MLSGDVPGFLLLPVAELCQAELHPVDFLHKDGDLGSFLQVHDPPILGLATLEPIILSFHLI